MCSFGALLSVDHLARRPRRLELVRDRLGRLSKLVKRIDLLGLLLPDLVVHPQALVVLFRARCPVRTSQAVPQCEVLAVVVVEVQVMHRVVCSTVDHCGLDDHLAIVDQHRPKVDQHKHGQVDVLLHREHEHKDVVGHRLQVPVHGMESVGRVRSRDDPLVVGLL